MRQRDSTLLLSRGYWGVERRHFSQNLDMWLTPVLLHSAHASNTDVLCWHFPILHCQMIFQSLVSAFFSCIFPCSFTQYWSVLCSSLQGCLRRGAPSALGELQQGIRQAPCGSAQRLPASQLQALLMQNIRGYLADGRCLLISLP